CMAEAINKPSTNAHSAKMIGVVAALAAGFALIPRATRGCESLNDQPAPEFSATLVANAPEAEQKTLSLTELRGKPIVLDFWATWCGPCQVSAPIVNSVSQRYRDKGLVVVGVNVDDDAFPVPRFVH